MMGALRHTHTLTWNAKIEGHNTNHSGTVTKTPVTATDVITPNSTIESLELTFAHAEGGCWMWGMIQHPDLRAEEQYVVP